MTYHLITYGCQMNLSDSERIDSILQSNGFLPAPKNKADFIILNACSVRQSAIDRVWGQIHNLKSSPRPPAIILTGCVLPSDKKKFQVKIDLLLDIKNLSDWPQKIISLKSETKNSTPAQRTGLEYFDIHPKYQSPIRAFVPIMTGCNNFCSYCAVPYTRGAEKSRPPHKIIQEVYKLIIQGYREIILLGQNVNSYRGQNKTSAKKTSFAQLLKAIDRLKGDYWLSFISSHPKDLSPELINSFKTCRHLMPYLHLALQSGSDKIIKKMNRHYTAADYKKLIQKIRATKPNIALTTDIIVGFPGETEKDFQATARLMRTLKFDMAYIAEYSPRPNTTAAKLADNVSKKDKKQRREKLTQILKTTALLKNKSLIGQTVKILVEKYDPASRSLFGHTDQFKHVKIPLSTSHTTTALKNIGQFIQAKITSADPWSLKAKLNSSYDSP